MPITSPPKPGLSEYEQLSFPGKVFRLGRNGPEVSNKPLSPLIASPEEGREAAHQPITPTEADFRALADNLPTLCWIADGNGWIFWYNRRWHEYCGTTPEQMEGWGWQSVHSPDELPTVMARWQASIATGEPFDMVFPLRGADGLFRPFLTRAQPVRDANGTVSRWFGMNTEIAALQDAEQALRQSEERFRKVFEHSNDAIFVLDPEGNAVLEVNPAGITMFGYNTREELLATPLSEFHPGDLPAFLAFMRGVQEDGVGWTDEFACRAKGGHFVQSEISASSLVIDGRHYLLAIVRDVRERKRAEAALQRRAAQLQGLAAASLAITGAPTLAAKLDAVTRAAREIIGAHQAVVSLTRGPDWSQAINAVSLTDKYGPWRDYAAVPDGSGIYAQVCERNRPMRMTRPQLEAHPRWRGFGEHADKHPPMRGWAAVPLIGRDGRNLGLIQLSDKEDGSEFDEADEAMLVQLAQLASAAIQQSETEAALREAGERIQLALNTGAILGTWVWDVAADKFTADERFARTFSLDPDICREGVPLSLVTPSIHPGDWPEVEKLVGEALARGGPYRAEYRVRDVSGSYRWIEANGRCEHDPEGHAVRFPGVLIDIDERRRVEEQLREREADLRLLLNATADGFYAVDREGVTTRCNAAFLRMLGFAQEDDAVGRKLHDVIHHTHPDGSHYPKEECHIYRTAQTGEPAHVVGELFFRLDGSSFPVEYWVRPVFRNGELQGAVCSFIDISERKQAEEARQLLLCELNHRVKNLFAIASGMVSMTARKAASTTEMAQALSGRLVALARAHELIQSAVTFDARPSRPATLHELVTAVVAPHLAPDSRQLRISGPDVEVGPSAATSLALVLHELATNAAKYGGLSVLEGCLDIQWRIDREALSLTWTEQNGPIIEHPPERRGFGSQLARMTAEGQLGGNISFEWKAAGACIILTAALERLQR
jgi:PAS domain S-box-containing protein